ncbi:MAG: hypothetical protein ACRDRQ_11090 [Pseudonocardiaceae bacterium]
MFTLFAFLWAVAALFHVLGPSGRAVQIFSDPTTLGISHALLAMCALWLLLRPARDLPLVLVVVLGLITAWQEAPVLGNHWLVVALVDLALLLSVLATVRNGRIDRGKLAEMFLPLARWCLILFYSFAAFAKLNSAFFDTAVSCSNFYFDETVRSLGLDAPLTVGAGGLAHLLPLVAVMTELSIPILLLGRRTRIFGVVLGLVFHSLIALDLRHLFIDFSSVLTALFVMFLPVLFAVRALNFLRGRGAWLMISWVTVAGVVLGAGWIGSGSLAAFVFFEGRLLFWYVFDVAVLLGVVMWLAHHGRPNPERLLALPGKEKMWLLVVPALVVLNGLLPYFELRTGYVYTMYSNLRMVDGKSNHLIVRSSFPLANRQANLVKVVASSDQGLGLYATSNYLLPWDSFRAYLAENPDVAVTYERGGQNYVINRTSDYPELVILPPLLARKLLAMRAVDGSVEPRCQDAFLPAL